MYTVKKLNVSAVGRVGHGYGSTRGFYGSGRPGMGHGLMIDRPGPYPDPTRGFSGSVILMSHERHLVFQTLDPSCHYTASLNYVII